MRKIALATLHVALIITLSSSLFAAEKVKLDLVEGPKLTMVTKKGAMSRVLSAEKMDGTRAHQLKFTFHPAIKDKSIKVKMYRSDDVSQSKEILLGSGRKAVIDIDAGPTAMQVMVEEQGLLEKSTRIFCSLYTYPEGFKLASLNKAKAIRKPKELVEKVSLRDNLRKTRSNQRRVLKRLGLKQSEAEEFLKAVENAKAYVGKKDFGAVQYFLNKANKIYPCAEVYFWKAFVFGFFDKEKAEEDLAKAFQCFKQDKSGAELLGLTVNKSKARTHSLAANSILRDASTDTSMSKISLIKRRRKLEEHLGKIDKYDSRDSKSAIKVLRDKWQELEVAFDKMQKEGPVDPAKQLDQNVRKFLDARRLFVEKKYQQSLKILEKEKNLPEADALYLKAEILLQLGRREGARKALEKSIRSFTVGRCLAGKKGGTVPGAQGVVPPSSLRAALARVSLARYWAERFKREEPNVTDKKGIVSHLEKAIELVEKALEEVPAHSGWQSIVNLYRDERLKVLYPKFNKKS